jgi:hypothetical protein
MSWYVSHAYHPQFHHFSSSTLLLPLFSMMSLLYIYILLLSPTTLTLPQAGFHTIDGHLVWKGVSRSVISSSDEWTTVWAARRAQSWPPLERLALSKFAFTSVNMPDFLKNDPYDGVERTELPQWLALTIYANKMWEETHGATFRVEIDRKKVECA